MNQAVCFFAQVYSNLAVEPIELIEIVKKYPDLYDLTSKHPRKDPDHKWEIWRKIAQELKVEGKEVEVRTKWNGIRDSFRRNRRSRKRGQMSPSKKYKYEKYLHFLIPYLNDQEEQTEKYKNNEQKIVINELDKKTIIGPTEIDVDDIGSQDMTPDDEVPRESPNRINTTPLSTRRTTRYAARKRKLSKTTEKNEPQELISSIVTNKLDETKEKHNFHKNDHAVDAFLAGIAPSLKMLDPVRLIAAKGKIFNIVQEHELQQLNDNNKLNSMRCKSISSATLKENEIDSDVAVEVLWNSS